jgi:hypothetical protein
MMYLFDSECKTEAVCSMREAINLKKEFGPPFYPEPVILVLGDEPTPEQRARMSETGLFNAMLGVERRKKKKEFDQKRTAEWEAEKEAEAMKPHKFSVTIGELVRLPSLPPR